MNLFEWIQLSVEDFPEEEHRKPSAINGLILLILIVDDDRLKRIASSYLRDANIPSINAIVDEHFVDV